MKRDAPPREPEPAAAACADVAVSRTELCVQFADGRSRWLSLEGAVCEVSYEAPGPTGGRVLTLARGGERLAVLAREGAAVVPARGASPSPPPSPSPSSPPATSDVAVVDDDAWAGLASWVASGGRLSALSFEELARLATVALPSLAVELGAFVATRAVDLAALAGAPHRAGAPLALALTPLRRAAAASRRAAVALASAREVLAGLEAGAPW